MSRRILSIFLENESGALSRVVGLFSQRNYNIETLTVAPTQDPTLSRINMTTKADSEQLEQLNKQLNKLISVFKVIELSEQSHIEREVAFIKVRATGNQRSEIKRTADIFEATIVDVTNSSYIVQMVGKSKTIDALVRAIDPKLITELSRSGACAIARGNKAISIQ